MKKTQFTVLLLVCLAASTMAQEKKSEMPAGVWGAYLKQSKHCQEQMEALLQAIPQEKFGWRPMEGVRSIAESFMHTALGNYMILSKVGGTVPQGVDMKALETSTTDKAKITEALKKSFEAVNQGVLSVKEADFTKSVDFFGMNMTVLDMIMLGATHQHELLGQQIAYARMNKVVPPWTEEMQKKMKEQPQKKGN